MMTETTLIRDEVLERFDEFSDGITEAPFGRVLSAASLFDFLDQLRADKFPLDWIERFHHRLDDISQTGSKIDENYNTGLTNLDDWKTSASKEDFAVRTGFVYSELWKDFSAEEYFENTRKLLEERFRNNNISVAGVKNALDDGCGAGRYTVALRKLGIAKVTGIDVSLEAIELAKQRNPYPENEVSFQSGSVLELPFEDNRFDFVFSNGVLHHTESTERGLEEIYRVTKLGGRIWLYLYGGKKSFFWDTVDICRKLLEGISQAYTQTVMKVMGYTPGRIMHRCDFFYVPVHRRYFASEVETMLREAGFTSFSRLERGAGIDWDEMKYQYPHLDPYIYGEGEMRYLITK
ncbi:class I SAM-dependent methyltransferase [Calditrichota bacterium]